MFVTSWKVLKRRLCNRLIYYFLSKVDVFATSLALSSGRSVFSKTYPSFLTLKEGSSKIIPSFFTIKEGSTFLTKPLFPQGREDVTALQCCICPTCPSPAGGSLIHSQALALSKRARDVTALRCSEPLRSKVGGASKPCAMLCGMGPPGERWRQYGVGLL